PAWAGCRGSCAAARKEPVAESSFGVLPAGSGLRFWVDRRVVGLGMLARLGLPGRLGLGGFGFGWGRGSLVRRRGQMLRFVIRLGAAGILFHRFGTRVLGFVFRTVRFIAVGRSVHLDVLGVLVLAQQGINGHRLLRILVLTGLF